METPFEKRIVTLIYKRKISKVLLKKQMRLLRKSFLFKICKPISNTREFSNKQTRCRRMRVVKVSHNKGISNICVQTSR